MSLSWALADSLFCTVWNLPGISAVSQALLALPNPHIWLRGHLCVPATSIQDQRLCDVPPRDSILSSSTWEQCSLLCNICEGPWGPSANSTQTPQGVLPVFPEFLPRQPHGWRRGYWGWDVNASLPNKMGEFAGFLLFPPEISLETSHVCAFSMQKSC